MVGVLRRDGQAETDLLTPVVLVYQAWTYWVFRRRLGPEDFPEGTRNPLDLIADHS